jgi:hypothetical protein
MGERKVQNRYIPPDIDPSRRLRNPHRIEQGRMELRNMLPFSIWCLACSNFMVRGTKFNSKVEDVVGEDYVGVKIKRIIGKCSQCNALFSYKTDLKNVDYTMESGATRNFELWKDTLEAKEEAKREKEEAEEFDPMKALEHRTEESRRQMEEMDYLAELKAKSRARVEAGLGPDAVLAAMRAGSSGGGGASSRATVGLEDGGGGGGGGGGGASTAEWGGDLEGEEAEDAERASAAFAAARGAKRIRLNDQEKERDEGKGGSEGSSSNSSTTTTTSAAAGSKPSGLSAFGARFIIKHAATTAPPQLLSAPTGTGSGSTSGGVGLSAPPPLPPTAAPATATGGVSSLFEGYDSD